MHSDHNTIVSATITFRYADGCSNSYEIHEGAVIRADLSGGSDRQPDEPYDNARHPEFYDQLRMELHARAGGAGAEFVTLTRSQATAS